MKFGLFIDKKYLHREDTSVIRKSGLESVKEGEFEGINGRKILAPR